MTLTIPQLKRLGVSGLTLYPFILLQNRELKRNKRIMNHEQIHIRQQAEMLVIPFYVVYLLEFAIGLLKYKNRFIAYQNISFEREAYQNDRNMEYLKKRKYWNWIQYLKLTINN